MRLFNCAILVTLLALMQNLLLAQKRHAPFKLGLGAGVSAPYGDLGDVFDTSFTFASYVIGPLCGSLAWRAEFGYDRLGLDDEIAGLCARSGQSCSDSRTVRFNGGVQFSPPITDQLRPFGYFTVGIYNFDEGRARWRIAHTCGAGPSAVCSQQETAFGIGIGGGLSWSLSEHWGVTFDVSIHGVDDSVTDTTNVPIWGWSVTPRVFLTWTF